MRLAFVYICITRERDRDRERKRKLSIYLRKREIDMSLSLCLSGDFSLLYSNTAMLIVEGECKRNLAGPSLLFSFCLNKKINRQV